MQAAQNLADFLDEHKAAIKLNGNAIQADDPKLVGELNRLINAIAQKGEAVKEAQRRLGVTMHCDCSGAP